MDLKKYTKLQSEQVISNTCVAANANIYEVISFLHKKGVKCHLLPDTGRGQSILIIDENVRKEENKDGL